jgi:hypothetical protein
MSDRIEKGASSGERRGDLQCHTLGNHRREKTMVEAPFPNPPRDVEREPSFAKCLRHVRRRLVLKQACLSLPIGCSEAAVSFWEAGYRLPTRANLQRLLEAIGGHGATEAEQLSLRQAWFRDKSKARLRRRSVVAVAGALSSLGGGYGL